MSTIFLLCLILIVTVTISYYLNKEGFTNISTANNGVLEMIMTKDEANKNVTTASNAAAKALDDKDIADKQVLDAISAADKAKAVAAAASKKAGELMSNSATSQADKDSAVASVNAANKAADEAVAVKVAAVAAAAAAAVVVEKTAADKVAAIATAAAASKQADKVIADRIESDTRAQTLSASSPSRTDIVPEINISENGQDARILQQKSELLKDIQKVVRNEILANRHTTPIMDENSCQDDSGCDNKNNTTATFQGKEYAGRCHKNNTCSQQPDMSQYIKKDSIPCWGCSLDY
jgi:hypothetical protein